MHYGGHFGRSHDLHPGILNMTSECHVINVNNNYTLEARETILIDVFIIHNWQIRYELESSELFKHILTMFV